MKKGSNGFLFLDWEDWLDYVKNAVATFLISLFSIVYAIAIGLVTLLVYGCKQIKRFIWAYPVPVLSFICVVLLLWVLAVFVNFSAKLKSCQMERDSVAYEKMKLEQAFIGDTIVIRGHSTRKEKAELIE